MSDTICLRCDWSGDTTGKACPVCGTGLFTVVHAKPARARRRRGRRPARGSQRSDPLGPEPPIPVARSSPARGWVVTGLVGTAMVVAFVVVSSHTPPAAPALPRRVAPGLDGTLIYAAQDRGGWGVWSWNLTTGEVVPGPHVPHPVELVDASSAGSGWIGVTSADGRQRVASILHHLSSTSTPITIASGDRVTWSSGGEDVTSLRFGARTVGCRRHVVITSSVVSFGTSDVRFDGSMCGLPLTIARDGTFIYVVAARGTSASIRFVSSGYTERFIDDHVLVSLSKDGDFLVTPVPRTEGEAAAVPPQGLQLYHRSPADGGPVSFGSKNQPLLVEDFLTWSTDAGDAYVLGSYGDVRGIYRIIMGPGVGLRAPELIDQTNAATVEATPTAAGDLIVLEDGALSYVDTDGVHALSAPSAAPQPAGSLLWTSSSAPGLA